MISHEQAAKASALCDRMLETIAKLQRNFDEMKVAADEFEARMKHENEPHNTHHRAYSGV
jgi:hypothetical protein